jgi:hypothetical protein
MRGDGTCICQPWLHHTVAPGTSQQSASDKAFAALGGCPRTDTHLQCTGVHGPLQLCCSCYPVVAQTTCNRTGPVIQMCLQTVLPPCRSCVMA